MINKTSSKIEIKTTSGPARGKDVSRHGNGRACSESYLSGCSQRSLFRLVLRGDMRDLCSQGKFNFFGTGMSDSQSDRFLSVLEHAIVPVRAIEFAEMETGLEINCRLLKDACNRRYSRCI